MPRQTAKTGSSISAQDDEFAPAAFTNGVTVPDSVAAGAAEADGSSPEFDGRRREDSLKKRYAYKLSANLIVFCIGILTAGIIPRGLGPKAYGDFSFLTDFFSKVVGFFATGSSFGFFVKISHRRTEYGLIRFYWGFVLLAILALVSFISITLLLGHGPLLWPSQAIKFIWLAAFFGVLTWVSDSILKMVDAYALTVQGEVVRVVQKILGASLLSLMFWSEHFSLTEFFIYQYFILLFACAAWGRVLYRNGVPLLPRIRLTWERIGSYTREFYTYSSPLFTYSLVGLLVGIFDRWILQKLYGSTEQGFYGFSYSVGTICFLFTSAMTPLFMREFAVAFGKGNRERMRHLFSKHLPRVYFLTAYLAAFASLQSGKIIILLGGSRFEGAQMAVAIMALYPVHQTYGQLTGSIYYATAQTTVYRNIGVFFMLLGLPLVFLLLAPQEMHGIGLGATGLALKMVALQFVWTNALLWHNCKYLGLRFGRVLVHQIHSLLILGSAAFAAILCIDSFITNALASFLVSGFVYTLLTAMLVFCWPGLVSLTRSELLSYVQKLKFVNLRKGW